MIKTLSLKKLITLSKLKSEGRIYDKEWRMWFDCEEDRQEFITAIERAENETVTYTQEEVDKYFWDKYEI